jgi:hypothetical protein
MSDLALEHLKTIQAKLAQIERNHRDTLAELVSLRAMMGEFIKSDARHRLQLTAPSLD